MSFPGKFETRGRWVASSPFLGADLEHPLLLRYTRSLQLWQSTWIWKAGDLTRKQVVAGLNNGKQSPDGFLFAKRIVPVRTEGSNVFVRTLRHGEEDTGESVKLREGDRLVFEAGGFEISTEEIDSCSPKGFGGYAPVANTVWTWYRIAPTQVGFFLFFFSLARRLDATHTLWAQAIQEVQAENERLVDKRIEILNALALAEMTVVALHRVLIMAKTLATDYCPDLEIPTSVQNIEVMVRDMRNAFEHIDERAKGMPGNSESVLEALSIFDQPDFISATLLRYKNHVLDFDRDVRAALLDCRGMVMQAFDSRIPIDTADNEGADK